VPRNEDRSFLTQAQEGMKEWWALMEERGTRADVPMRPQIPAWNLWPLLDDDAIICGDSGTVTTWAARLIKLRGKQRFSFSGTNCSMAAGLPYAIGAQAAYPGRQVVAFTGDGSMTMQLGDFLTCVQHALPVKVVVVKNNTLGLIKWEQMVFLGNPEYGVHFAPMDFVKFAEACGAHGVRIDDPQRCGSQLQEALAKPGPAIIECVVDEHEPPMPAKVKRDQAVHMYQALAQGTPNRKTIALTIVGDVLEESGYEASPGPTIPNPVGAAARKIVETITRKDDGA
jgi:pyruvate dehydrogenase (quinone)/pyruvate oxidase